MSEHPMSEKKRELIGSLAWGVGLVVLALAATSAPERAFPPLLWGGWPAQRLDEPGALHRSPTVGFVADPVAARGGSRDLSIRHVVGHGSPAVAKPTRQKISKHSKRLLY
jgi:hypothetical protein